MAESVRLITQPFGIGLVDPAQAYPANAIVLAAEIPFGHDGFAYGALDKRTVRLPDAAVDCLVDGRHRDLVIDWSGDVVRVMRESAWPHSYRRPTTGLALEDERTRVQLAMDPLRPVELRLEALRGIRQTEDDPWPPGSLDAYHALIVDRTLSFEDRLQATRGCSAFGDPLEDDRKALLREILDAPDAPPHLQFSTACAVGGVLGVQRLAQLLGTRGQIGDLARARLRSIAKTKSKASPKGVRRMAKEALGTGHVEARRHVFVSYVRDDKAGVDRLVGDLRSFGVPIWRDTERLKPGERWRTAIARAIEEGDAFVAVFSKDSEARDRSFMRDELVQAVEQLRLRPFDRAWFFPVLLSPCELPPVPIGAGQTLGELQYVDLSEHWDDGVHALALALTKTLTRRSP